MGIFETMPVRACLLALALVACAVGEDLPCDIADPVAPLVVIDGERVEAAGWWGTSELWRAGGLRDGSSLTFPTSGRVGPQGWFAVPDFALGTVWLFGPGGEWRGSMGERGRGPGELMAPIAVGWSDDGELFVLDAGQGKLETFNIEVGGARTVGLPAGFFQGVVTTGEVGWFGVRGDGAAYLEFPARGLQGTSTWIRFARVAPGEENYEVVWEREYPSHRVPGYDVPNRPEWSRSVLGVGPTGWVVAPESSRYEFVVYSRSDAPLRHLCVDGQQALGQGGGPSDVLDSLQVARVGASEPASDTALFSRILIDQDDRIWVERTLPQVGAPWDQLYGVPGAQFDVMSSGGDN
jgi:hypothetical protein